MNKEDMMNNLGRIGEKIVANYMSRNGKIVQESIDPYDRTRDMMVDGNSVEVKTQVPFIIENSFSFKQNQLHKCRNVDILFFIAAPAPKHKYKWEGWLFAVEPKKFKTKQRVTKDGRKMILIPIEQDAVKPIEKISDSDLNVMRKYTVSEY